MIYTITLNPSIDYIVSVDNFELGKTNRTQTEQYLAGGKGINVAHVLTNLELPATALGLIAGFTGKAILEMAKADGVKCDFIEVKEGLCRINLKLKNVDGTEINGMGPNILLEHIDQIVEKLKCATKDDTIVLSGSIPKGLNQDTYAYMMKKLAHTGACFVVDATGEQLMSTLDSHPFLIKPNVHELNDIFDVEISELVEVEKYAKQLQERGAQNVIVSMGGDGALFVSTTGEVFHAQAPSGTLKNSVGSGDSMVAGFIAGWSTQRDYAHAFKMAVSAGSASAFSDYLATNDEIQAVYDRCKIEQI